MKKLICAALLFWSTYAFAAFPDGWSLLGYVDLPAPSATLTDFPVLVKLPSDVLGISRSDLGDFRPTIDSAGTTALHFDIPEPVTGIAWVKIPSYSTSGNGYNGTNTRVFFWGNNATATMPDADDTTWGSEGVWDSNTILMYHMNDLATSTVEDATSGGNDGTKYAANNPAVTTSGKIGSAQVFPGTSGYISTPVTSTAKSYTYNEWVKGPSGASKFKYVFDSNTGRIICAWNSNTSGKLGAFSSSGWKSFGNAPTDQAWHMLTWVFDSTNSTVDCYVDGVQSGTQQAYTGTNIGGLTNIGNVSATGVNSYGPAPHTGDEIILADTVRSEDWITTMYDNQSDVENYGTYTDFIHTITITHSLDGSITGNLIRYIIDGDDCTIVAVPDTGYTTEWSGSYGTDNSLTISNVTADIDLHADFIASCTALSTQGYSLLGYIDLPAPSVDLTYFPALISLPESLTSAFNYQLKDLRLTFDQSGTHPLAFELPDKSTIASCMAEIWVRIPDYTAAGNGYSGTNTRIFVWGDNPAATAPESTDTVWGSERVWLDGASVAHLHEATASVLDSSENGNDGTKNGTTSPEVVSAIIGEGQAFDGNDYITFPSNMITSGECTISTWVQSSSGDFTDYGVIISDRDADLTGPWWFLRINADNKPYCQIATNTSTGYIYAYGDVAINDDDWHLVTVTFDGTDTIKIYVDGTDSTVISSSVGTVAGYASNSSTICGKLYNNTYSFTGALDEIRLLTDAKSPGWIAASYNNQISPETYWEFTSLYTTESFTTFYVGNSGTIYGNSDGTTETDAWSGWDDVDWDVVGSGDTIIDFSNERFVLDEKRFNEECPLIIDGAASYINGLTTVNSANWTNLSGNIYYVQATTPDIDYYQATAPASPTAGDKWMLTATTFTGSTMGPCSGIAYEYRNGEWQPCDFFYRVNMAWKDGIRKYPVTTFATAVSQSGFDGYHISSAAYGGHADNYWVGCPITIQTANYRWETSTITASSGNQVTFGKMSYTSLIAAPTGGSYIIGQPGRLSADGEWCYDPATGYFYVYSTDNPALHTWEYSDNGKAILIRESSGITVKNYTIKHTNDNSITAYKSPHVSIINNTISDTYPAGNLYENGAIGIYASPAPDAAWFTETMVDGVLIQNNKIANTYNGSGMWLQSCNIECTGNSIVRTGDPYRYNSVPCGLQGLRANGTFSNNYIYYSLYSGIQLLYTSGSTISYNVISHSMDMFEDGGCLYLADNVDGNPGGNILEYNRIEYWGPQDGVSGIYLDNYASYNTVRNNVFYNGPAGAAPSIAVLQPNVHFGVEYNAFSDNTAYTLSGTMIDGYGWPEENVGNTTFNNVFANPADYPYLSSGSSGAAMLLMIMR